jgi:Ni/Fe-hydrogenase b-type cytochrome subunit
VNSTHASAKLVYRHNRVTRLTHWINAIALPILFMSGLQIFNAHPNLYWGHTSGPDEAFLSIYSEGATGGERGYLSLFSWRIDTTGFLGVQHTEMGNVQQGFPGWLTIPSYFWLAGGRQWHFFFGWFFFLNGLLYIVYNLLNGHMRKFFLTPRDAAKIPAMALYYLRLRSESPQEDEYNPLQKMAYTSVFVLLTPLIMLSGMAMSPQLDVAFHWLPAMFGGRQSARAVHFMLTFAFTAFVFGHVFMVLTTGVFNNMRSMITGWYKGKVPAFVEPPLSPIVESEATTPSANIVPAGPAAERVGPVERREPNSEALASPGETAPEVKTTGDKNDQE